MRIKSPLTCGVQRTFLPESERAPRTEQALGGPRGGKRKPQTEQALGGPRGSRSVAHMRSTAERWNEEVGLAPRARREDR